MEALTGKDLIEYEKKYGPRNLSNITKILDNVRPFNTAIQSEIGKELSKDLLGTIKNLLPKVIEMTATDEEQRMLKCYLNIFYQWEKKILAYENGVLKIKLGKQ